MMKYTLLGGILTLLFSCALCASCNAGHEQIMLTKDNHITIHGTINDKLANEFLSNAATVKDPRFIYIHSPGGSVIAGNRLVRHIQSKNYTCIADQAVSMAFVILQACAKRYSTSTSMVMQHQTSLGYEGDLQAMNAYLKMVNFIEKELTTMQATRIGMSEKEFRDLTVSEWWLYGSDIVEHNVTDKIVDVECSRELYKETVTRTKYTFFGDSYNVTHSACPLIYG